ncbi:HAD family hydrolase [Phenylobacterium immobile]|uniref:HAD family hydrolase n=1 Tax=Phenylobacterium immobile TaxID=21 RepID=UPI000B15AABB|nr:HAD-IA family hydrolase [Phenylobacterium immobile]
MTLKALMVDVDGVLIVHPPGQRWDDHLHRDLGLERDALGRAFFAVHWPDVELGRADLYDRLRPVLATIAPHLPAETLTAYWFEKDAALDHDLLADLKAARETGLVLHLATVQEHHRARYLWDTLGFRDRFDAIHYSADVRSKKPQPEFYDEVARRTGFASHEIRLIDDRLANVDAAVAAGWSGFHWKRGSRLAEALS